MDTARKLNAVKPDDHFVQVLVQKRCLHFGEPILIAHGKSNLALGGIAARFLSESGVFVRSECSTRSWTLWLHF
eukprot:1774288-Amphidinium_carterae.1